MKREKMKPEKLDEFLQESCMVINDLWVKAGGPEMKGELQALNDVLDTFFQDKLETMS